jgi:hypothetical protein
MTDRIPISDIKIGPRIRKDLGDIQALASTITAAEGQLIHPVGAIQRLIMRGQRLPTWPHLVDQVQKR